MEKKQEKAKNPFYKKWWFITIAVVLAIGAIASNGNKEESPSNLVPSSQGAEVEAAPETASTATPEPQKSNEKEYKNGQYLVGTDIDAGLYRAVLTDTIMEMGYVEILSTDKAVKLQGVTLQKISLDELEQDFKAEVEGGIYLVGYDLQPGTYKAEVTDTITEMGYLERSSSVAMNMEDIIANEIIQGQGYIEILESDFAVRVQGAKLIFQE